MRSVKMRSICMLLALLFIITSFAGCAKSNENSNPTEEPSQEATAAPSEAGSPEKDPIEHTYGDTVATVQAGDNEILLYYPTPNAADTLGLVTVCTAPTILVFGDTKFDENGAIEFATESGLAALAAENAASVCFVNPQDETWSEKDQGAYANAAGAILSTTHDPIENGVVKRVDFESGEEIPSIAGNQMRILAYGIGQGADYLAGAALKQPVMVKMFYGYDVDVTPAACSLENCTVTEGIEKSDIPVVSINNSEEINQILKENCGSVQVETSADYAKQFSQVMGRYRRQVGRLAPVYDWSAEGVVELVKTYEVKTSSDNASEKYAGTQTHPINYILYYGEDLDVKNGKVPLVLCFHGGGNSALHEVMMTDWPMIGKENGFMTCSIDQHNPDCSATEIIELIDALKSEYSIDESRIYASGFSMGGCKSWDMFEQYPEVFAALAPMDASQEAGTDSYNNPVANGNTDTLVPVFYVGGEASPLEELPFQAEKVVGRMAQVFGINQVKTAYDVDFAAVDSWANKIWGVNGDLTYTVGDDIFTDSVLTVELFQSQDGHYYTALASASNQAHEIYARNSWAAWDFMSQFSRNEDGSINVENVTYRLQSEDGSVVDNSYNQ